MCEQYETTARHGRPRRHPSWCEHEPDLGQVAALLQDAKSELSRELSDWLDWQAREHPDFPRQWLEE